MTEMSLTTRHRLTAAEEKQRRWDLVPFFRDISLVCFADGLVLWIGMLQKETGWEGQRGTIDVYKL